MKHYSALLLAGLFCLAATPLSAATATEKEICTPEVAIDKAGVVAQLIYDMTKNNPGKAEELRERMNQMQEENPVDSSFDACQAYQRLIDALGDDAQSTGGSAGESAPQAAQPGATENEQ
ncbi:MAG: hypothetical protein V7756_06220 [Halopseudomonas sp.]|uniref:hypothetical protein n=1 Tax=Halopseudomonas sp. TaxID=2901191 RepID=UPI0030016CC3